MNYDLWNFDDPAMLDMVRAIENGIGIKCLVKVIPSKTKTVTFNIEPHGC